MRKLLSTLTISVALCLSPAAFADDDDSAAVANDDDSAAVVADTTEADTTEVDPAELVDLIVRSLEAGNLNVAFGAFILLLLYGYRRYGHKLKYDSKYVPWVAIAITVLAEVGISLKGDVPLAKALVDGAMIALGGSGFWVLIQGKGEPEEEEE
jgi:hypothetical protein